MTKIRITTKTHGLNYKLYKKKKLLLYNQPTFGVTLTSQDNLRCTNNLLKLIILKILLV